MPVLVTSKFHEDPIKIEHASLETPFSHYKIVEIFRRSRAPDSKGSIGSSRNSNSSEILCLTSLPSSLMKIRSELKALAWGHCCPHYKSMGAFCCH